jgi:hypothetical protein
MSPILTAQPDAAMPVSATGHPPSPPARASSGRLAGFARFSVRHRRAVLVSWLVLFLAGIALGGQVFSDSRTQTPGGRSRPTVPASCRRQTAWA